MKFIPNLELGSARAVFPEPSFLQLMQRLLLMVILVILALICSTSVTTLAYSSNTSEGWPLLHTSQTLASAVTSSLSARNCFILPDLYHFFVYICGACSAGSFVPACRFSAFCFAFFLAGLCINASCISCSCSLFCITELSLSSVSIFI